MQSYSQDLRERVLRALDRGERPTEIARRFEVSRVWVYQVRDRLRQTGERSSSSPSSRPSSAKPPSAPVTRSGISSANS